jgi:hypothetical protein
MPENTNENKTLQLAGGASRYVDGTETIRLTAFSAAAGVTLALSGRVLVDDGRVVPFNHRLAPTSDRVATIFETTLPCGWLLGASARVTGGAPADGLTYGAISIGYGAGAQFTELEVLAAGTITAARKIAFPFGPILGPLDSPGALRAIVGTDPAAGAEVSETVPTGARQELIAFRVTLVTDATVASRNPILILDDGANAFYHMASMLPITASLTSAVAWGKAAQLSIAAVNSVPTSALPVDNDLLGGFRIRTSTAALQAGDNYGAPVYLVRERIEGA